MATVGDRVQVPSKRVGQAPRQGVVIGASASGLMLQVRWSSGEESTITPSMGSLVVVGRARRRDSQPTVTGKRAGSKKGTGAAKTTKKATKEPTKKVVKSPTKKAVKSGAKKAVKSGAKKAAKSPKPSGGARAKSGGKGSVKGSRNTKAGRTAKQAK